MGKFEEIGTSVEKKLAEKRERHARLIDEFLYGKDVTKLTDLDIEIINQISYELSSLRGIWAADQKVLLALNESFIGRLLMARAAKKI